MWEDGKTDGHFHDGFFLGISHLRNVAMKAKRTKYKAPELLRITDRTLNI